MDLNLDRTELRRDFFTQDFSIDNVTPFHRDDFVSGDIGNRKQTVPINLALVHFRFWREIGKGHHLDRLAEARALFSAVDTTAATTLR
jgi:hypothetical protein